MRKLNSILNQQNDLYFPVKGMNGYAGEQDRSRVIFGGFRIWSREEAKKVMLPDFIKLHWAAYIPGRGWEGAVGYWDNAEMTIEDERLLRESCEYIDWE